MIRAAHFTRSVALLALSLAGSLASSGCAMRQSSPPSPCPCSIVTLKDLKPMIGSWHGKTDDGKKVEVITRETSGGSAIEETLFPGSPHEMVSIYVADPSGVQMTHYCMLENQPVLRAEKIAGNEFLFKFAGGTNVTPGKGQYMNEMRLTLIDEHHIREEWSSVKDGQKTESTSFDLWNCSGCKTKKKCGSAESKSGCRTKNKK